MRRHEAHHSKFGSPGRPYQFREFPTMMYRAARNPAGQVVIVEAQTANDEHAQRSLESRGFAHGGQAAALEAVERREQELAELAAVEDAAGARHLGTVAEAPKRPKPTGAAAIEDWNKERAQNSRAQQEK